MQNELDTGMLVVDKDDVKRYSLDDVLDKVIWGDALKVLKKLPDESVDLVFMDPPYFLQIGNKKLKRWNVKTDDAAHPVAPSQRRNGATPMK